MDAGQWKTTEILWRYLAQWGQLETGVDPEALFHLEEVELQYKGCLPDVWVMEVYPQHPGQNLHGNWWTALANWKGKAKEPVGLFCFRIKGPHVSAHFSVLQNCFLFVALLKGAGGAGSWQETGRNMGLLSGCQEKSRGTHKAFKETFCPSLLGTVSIVLNPSLIPVTWWNSLGVTFLKFLIFRIIWRSKSN